jgi:hypothetical protein
MLVTNEQTFMPTGQTEKKINKEYKKDIRIKERIKVIWC